MKDATLSDEQLVALLRNKDKAAMGAVLKKYGDALYGVVFRIVGTREVAEDIMQEVAVKIWKNHQAYDAKKGRLFTWLVNIARNTAIDKVRTQKFQARRQAESLDSTVHDNIRFSEHLDIQDVGLRRLIERLDPKYREVIDLLYLKGYTQKEATEALGIPLGTVKTRVKKALGDLLKALKDRTALIIFLIWWIS